MRPISGIPSIFLATLAVLFAVPVGIATLLVWWHCVDLRNAHATQAQHTAEFIAQSLSRVPAAQRDPWLHNLLGRRDGGLEVLTIETADRNGRVTAQVSREREAAGMKFEARNRNGDLVSIQVAPQSTAANWFWGIGLAVMISLAACAAYFVAVSPIANSFLHSLEEVTRAVLTFRQSNFSARVGETGIGRFRVLERAVNQMGESVEEQVLQSREIEDRATEELQATLEEVEIKNVELDLARKRALDDARSKSRFLANMSHEIRTPMNSIVGYAQLLKGTRLDEAQQGYADSISQSTATLLDIIEDILSLARLEAGKVIFASQEFDIRRIVRQSVDMLAPMAYQKGLQLRTNVDVSLPACLIGDPLRIRQILVNLLTNAVKYTQRGEVEINVRCVRQAARNVVLYLSVADTGRGISREDRTQLFEAFTNASRQERQGGAGLGLTIARALTQAMGGQLSLESEVDVGSTFLARLPLKSKSSVRFRFIDELASHRVLVALEEGAAKEHLLQHLGHACMDIQQCTVAQLQRDQVRDITAEVIITAIDLPDVDQTLTQWPSHYPPAVVLLPTADHRVFNRVARTVRGVAIPAYADATHILAGVARQLGIEIDGLDMPKIEPVAPLVAGARALIADDDRLGRVYLQELLSKHGVEVTSCSDGQEAVTIARNAPFDIIFMDARMPLCDGVEAARQIRARSLNEDTLIVALTASASREDRDLFASVGVVDCLIKPAAPARLLELIAANLRANAQPPASAAAATNGHAAPVDSQMQALLHSELVVYRESLHALREPFDHAGLLHIAHRLHGAAAICRLAELESAAAALESALRSGATDDAKRHIVTVLACVEETIAEGTAQ